MQFSLVLLALLLSGCAHIVRVHDGSTKSEPFTLLQSNGELRYDFIKKIYLPPTDIFLKPQLLRSDYDFEVVDDQASLYLKGFESIWQKKAKLTFESRIKRTRFSKNDALYEVSRDCSTESKYVILIDEEDVDAELVQSEGAKLLWRVSSILTFTLIPFPTEVKSNFHFLVYDCKGNKVGEYRSNITVVKFYSPIYLLRNEEKTIHDGISSKKELILFEMNKATGN